MLLTHRAAGPSERDNRMVSFSNVLIALGGAIALVAVIITWELRRRNVHYWLGSYLAHSLDHRKSVDSIGDIHVLLCIADHFEPGWGQAGPADADKRVEAWTTRYRQLFAGFRDSDGHPPRHTFFYPIDEYEPRHVDALARLCREGFGEVEIHLHHDNDTADHLDRNLQDFVRVFSQRHGLLGRSSTDRPVYAFVHGNWALDNSRPDGRWCGVNNELEVLQRTGCYADFTLPSAPDATQTRKINSIYYAIGREHCCKSHDTGIDVARLPAPDRGLMLIQGPLLFGWSKGKLFPGIENGCIQHNQPPTMARLDRWMKANVHVPSRPDWLFVKLYTHGAVEVNSQVLLGGAMVDFHRSLAERAKRDNRFHFHYVTAREMYNLAKAAEAGWKGPVEAARNFAITPPQFNASQTGIRRAASATTCHSAADSTNG
jgi:hypothetical protein